LYSYSGNTFNAKAWKGVRAKTDFWKKQDLILRVSDTVSVRRVGEGRLLGTGAFCNCSFTFRGIHDGGIFSLQFVTTCPPLRELAEKYLRHALILKK